FAAMIPAICAVTSASPFGSSRKRAAVAEAIPTEPRASARRRECGFPPTSTIRTSPASETCESSPIAGNLASRDHTFQRRKLTVDPNVNVMLAHLCRNRAEPAPALVLVQLERPVNGVRLIFDVERIDRDHPVTELRMCTGVFR